MRRGYEVPDADLLTYADRHAVEAARRESERNTPMIENPPNTRPAWKRYRDLTPGDFVVGRGVVTDVWHLFAYGRGVVDVLTADGKRDRQYAGVEALVRVPAGTPVTESRAVAVVAR